MPSEPVRFFRAAEAKFLTRRVLDALRGEGISQESLDRAWRLAMSEDALDGTETRQIGATPTREVQHA